MFQSVVRFEPAAASVLERALEQAGWSDVLEVHIGDRVVYNDDLGNANDVSAVFSHLHDRMHAHHESFTVLLGRQDGTWRQILRAHSTRLFVSWEVVSRDEALDALPEETEAAHCERVAALTVEGGVKKRAERATERFAADLESAEAAGMVVRPGSEPRTFFEAGVDRTVPFHAAFLSYAGSEPARATEHALLVGLTRCEVEE